MGEDRYIALDNIILEKGKTKKSIIPLLQAIQENYNFLPEDVLKKVCERTEITPDQLMGVASFYSQFRLEPTGEHIVKVCTGTACHVKRAELVYDAFGRALHLEEGKTTDQKGQYTLEKVNCLGCCTLAPVVQIDEVTYGHVDVEGVPRVLDAFEHQPKKKEDHTSGNGTGMEKTDGEIRIGLGSCCVASGSEEVKESVELAVVQNALNVKMKGVGCVGMCHQVPLLEIVPKGQEPVLYSKVQAEDVDKIVHRHFHAHNFWQRFKTKIYSLVEDIQTDYNWAGIDQYELNTREKQVSSFLDKQVPIATEYRGVIDPLDLAEYKRGFGFKALSRCLKEFKPQQIIDLIKQSGLRGRGGAGFSTGEKWQIFHDQQGETKFLICNGDEGDPGAFMDRMLLESYPYRIIEGMLIAARATGASHGYFYIRAEYPLAVERIRKALAICLEEGFLGQHILDSDFSFDIEIFEGAGAFICGEETALIASIEGNRGFPSLRPPYPVQEGLWNNPTLVNNTESFAQIPYILRNDVSKYSKLGTDNSKGTKVFALAGKIKNGGLIEVPMGISIREIVEDIGGGVAEGRKFKAVQIGGPSGGCVPEKLADTPVDFQSLKNLGAMMGSGGLVVLDDTDCMVDIARYFLSFTQVESCGKCTFCRIGTKRMLDILDAICSGKGKRKDLEELEKLAQWTKKGSLCGLGQTAPNPVLSTLTYFRDEYEAHINGVCPTGKCKDLITYQINDQCIGCTICAQHCPTDAIAFTPHIKHVIDQDKCIKCDGCKQVCPGGGGGCELTMVTIKINGTEKKVSIGKTILDVLRKNGSQVPTMCYLEGTEHFPTCMVCVVKNAANGQMIPSCSTLVQEGMDIIIDDEEVLEARKTSLELLLSDHVGECDAPCQTNCPAFLDIPLVNRLIAEGDLAAAIRLVKKELAFPGILGRICPAPCERACRRKNIDDPVAICSIERYLGDLAAQNIDQYLPDKKSETGKKIGIIGTGPGGLSAAYFLLQKGHACTLYDKNQKAGGALRYDVPEDRFPKEVLDKEIESVEMLGAKFNMNHEISKDSLPQLLKEYDAVIIASGEDNADFHGPEKKNKSFVVDKNTFKTSTEGVFAIGSAIKPGRVAIRAIANGKDVAIAVDQFLNGQVVSGRSTMFNSRIGKMTEEDHNGFMMEADSGPRNIPDGNVGFTEEQSLKEAVRCMHCDCRKKDDCKLRIYSDEYQASQSRYFPKERNPVRKTFKNKPVVYEPEKCIKCSICVKLTSIYKEELGLTYIGKGFDVEISAPFDSKQTNVLIKTGKRCAEMCPTAALAINEKEDLTNYKGENI